MQCCIKKLITSNNSVGVLCSLYSCLPRDHITSLFPFVPPFLSPCSGMKMPKGSAGCSAVFSCATYCFYSALKGIRSAHETFIKDTECVNVADSSSLVVSPNRCSPVDGEIPATASHLDSHSFPVLKESILRQVCVHPQEHAQLLQPCDCSSSLFSAIKTQQNRVHKQNNIH